MENTHLLKDKYYVGGISILLTSLLVYLLPVFLDLDKNAQEGLFVINYGLTLTYFFILFFNRKRFEAEKKLVYRFVFLTIFLISAYSLNRSITIFERSVPWFSATLVLSCTTILALPFIERAPKWVKPVMFTLTGAAFAVFTYMACYLLPISAFGLIGVILVGFPLHTFVPALYVFNLVKMMMHPQHASVRKYFIGGALIPLIIAITYTVEWNKITRRLNQQIASAKKEKMPVWINLARHTSDHPFLLKVLKAEMIYSAPRGQFDFFGFGEIEELKEPRRHDPIVQFALFFSPSIRMQKDDRERFIAALSGEGRTTEEERFWSGNDLITEHIDNNIRIWPACHLAYTDKVITVRNTFNGRWNNQQEAIYTFYLPEGGVVTSLSLWVNGVEEKAVLTTKNKADSAYATIVKREVRDPSIVTWQEGNKVSVRVFPVLSDNYRKFRIGFTAPLAKINGELLYQDIDFDGPDKRETVEVTNVEFNEPIEKKFSSSFVSKSESSYKRSGKYEGKWSMRFKSVKPSECTFSFNGNTYSISPYHKKLETTTIENIYLDLNSSWERSDYEQILKMAAGREVFVYDGRMVRVTSENKDELFDKFGHTIFSLFPLQFLNEPELSLVITSSAKASCSMDDIRESGFMDQLRTFLSKNKRVRLFNIGGNLSPYLRTLKEYRTFNYDHGSTDILAGLLSDSLFVSDTENDNSVIVHNAQIRIQKEPGEQPSVGPDHVMRLFAYNQVMYKLGNGILLKRDINDEIVSIAREAYVVTPVTSLIVLETQRDYERFDIKDQGASLKNASIGSSGAAPEPHEWALIILGASLLLYLRFGKRQTLSFR